LPRLRMGHSLTFLRAGGKFRALNYDDLSGS